MSRSLPRTPSDLDSSTSPNTDTASESSFLGSLPSTKRAPPKVPYIPGWSRSEHGDPFNAYQYHYYDDGDELMQNPAEALFDASRRGDVSAVKSFVAARMDVNSRDCDQETPLIEATKNAKLNVVEFLLMNGADIEAVGIYHKTCLHYACEIGNLTIVKFLLARGADVHRVSRFNENCLHFVARSGSLVILKLLIGRGIPTDAIDVFRRTPLHYASEGGHDKIVRLMLLQAEEARRERMKSRRRGPAPLEGWELKDIEKSVPEEIAADSVKPLFERIDVFEFSQAKNETEELGRMKEEVELYRRMFLELSDRMKTMQ